jgi:hypothetical protein
MQLHSLGSRFHQIHPLDNQIQNSSLSLDIPHQANPSPDIRVSKFIKRNKDDGGNLDLQIFIERFTGLQTSLLNASPLYPGSCCTHLSYYHSAEIEFGVREGV